MCVAITRILYFLNIILLYSIKNVAETKIITYLILIAFLRPFFPFLGLF